MSNMVDRPSGRYSCESAEQRNARQMATLETLLVSLEATPDDAMTPVEKLQAVEMYLTEIGQKIQPSSYLEEFLENLVPASLRKTPEFIFEKMTVEATCRPNECLEDEEVLARIKHAGGRILYTRDGGQSFKGKVPIRVVWRLFQVGKCYGVAELNRKFYLQGQDDKADELITGLVAAYHAEEKGDESQSKRVLN